MDIKTSKEKKGLIGICGHVGVGHTHSHSGFVQDDSVGFVVISQILRSALPIDTKIKNVEIIDEAIIVETEDGGIGKAFISSGITPSEKELMVNIIGMDSLYSQQIVIKTLGRICGQGTMKVAVTLQAAISLALLDTFRVKYPDKVTVVDEDISGNIGKILGTVVDIDNIPVSILITINATLNGLGPVEDLEGNIMLGNKGSLIKSLGLDKTPSIVIESKSYIPSICKNLNHNKFLIRGNREYDNMTVAKSLEKAAKLSNLPYMSNYETLDRDSSDFINSVKKLGEDIVLLGKNFKESQTSSQRVNLINDLYKLVSEDAGGVTFMSNALQKSVASAGMMKGTSAVLSLLVSKEYIDHYKIPYVVYEDVEGYISIVLEGVKILYENLEEAKKELENKFDFQEENYKYLF